MYIQAMIFEKRRHLIHLIFCRQIVQLLVNKHVECYNEHSINYQVMVPQSWSTLSEF